MIMKLIKWIGKAAKWIINLIIKYARLTIITLAVSLGISYGLWKT